jgi:predicted acetylornithine/succinylornithine family transaminase
MTSEQQVAAAREVLLGNYRSNPVMFREGKGCRLTDVDGKSYLDFVAGIAVVSVGHCHPELVRAISEQAGRLMHVSNLFYNEPSVELAAELARRTPYSKFFFCNSGAEANEGLLKLARRYHFERGDKERRGIITTLGSFHGRSMGALTMTGQPKYQEGMGPMVGGVEHVQYNDLAALERAVGPHTAAVILEPVQGEGGVMPANAGYLRSARDICDRAGALLMLDEVQTGYGRTGRFLAQEWSGVVADACALAKGIASGFPLGALAVSEKLSTGLPPGSHGTTYGGNPLACAAALAVLRIFDNERVVENAERQGDHLGKRLDAFVADSKLPAAAGARGLGLLRGLLIADNFDPGALVAAIRARGVLVSIAGGNVIRFSPPLVVSQAEIDEALTVVEAALRAAEPKRSGG